MVALQGGNALGLVLIDHLGVAAAVAIRLLLGSVFLVLLLRPRFRLRGRAEIRLVIAFGLVVAALSGTIYEAIERLPLGVAVTISLLGPLTVAALNSRRRADLIWPLLALGGVALMANSSGGSGPSVTALGIGFAFLNAAAWGAYIVLAERAGRHFDGVHGLALACIIAALLWLPAGVAGGGLDGLTLGVLGVAVATAIVATALPYSLENISLRRLPPRVFGTLMSLEPAIATVVGLVFLGQRPGLLALLGIVAVMVASLGASLPLSRGERRPAAPPSSREPPTPVPHECSRRP